MILSIILVVLDKKVCFLSNTSVLLDKNRIFATQTSFEIMKDILINQRKERDELLGRPYLERNTKYDKEQLLQSPLIKFISGPRRVGKSTYALLLLRGMNFAYLNFDDQLLLSQWDEDLVVRLLDDVYPDYQFLMLDEVQNLPEWDLWVSKLYRRGKNLIITGSNANMLSSEMATLLTGRYLSVEMLPFSLEEMFAWHHIDIQQIENQTETIALVDDYLRNGGYPETVAARNITQSYMSTLFDSILLKDITKRHKVRKTTELYDLASFLLANFCNPLSANGLATDLNLSSVSTTQKFCQYLSEPFLFFFLPRFNNKLKLIQKADRKVYVIDNGFVNSTAFNLSENLGRLLENQVFVELLRRGYKPGQTLFYYRSNNDKETDFVTRKGTKVEQLIQVSYSLSSERTRKREVDSIAECANELHCENLVIVTKDEEDTLEKNGHTIKVVPIMKF